LLGGDASPIMAYREKNVKNVPFVLAPRLPLT